MSSKEIAVEEYGIAREPSEGTLYLMKKTDIPKGYDWCFWQAKTTRWMEY